MKKTRIGSQIPPYPMPIALVGADVKDQPNFLTVAWFTMANFKPPCIMVVLHKGHFTNQGIRDNKTFSVNIPCSDMVSITDYCSTVSGRDINKSTLFKISYGTLKNAPMIDECPVTSECMLVQTVELATHDVFIGEIKEVYVHNRCLSDGIADITKIKPIMYVLYGNGYWTLGTELGKAMHLGKIHLTGTD